MVNSISTTQASAQRLERGLTGRIKTEVGDGAVERGFDSLLAAEGEQLGRLHQVDLVGGLNHEVAQSGKTKKVLS